MASIVMNIAKGRVARYADLPAANDALVLVLLKAVGLEADATLRDHDTLATLLAGTSDECDFTGYARRTLTGVTVTVDDTADTVSVDAADPAGWTNTGATAQAAGKAVICYDADTTTGTDADLVPLVALDAVVTFDPTVPVSMAFSNVAGSVGFFGAS